MTSDKEIIECRECNPNENPNECYLSACSDIVTGKVDFKCVGKNNIEVNMEKVKSIPKGFNTITPSLVVQGATDAIEFYKQAFGADVIRIFYGPDKKTIFHAELKIGDSILILSEEMPVMNLLSPKSPGGGTSASLYMYVDKVDDVFANAISAGASVKMPLMDTFYGDRCCAIIDPFGHLWVLGTHIRDLTDEEIKKFLS